VRRDAVEIVVELLLFLVDLVNVVLVLLQLVPVGLLGRLVLIDLVDVIRGVVRPDRGFTGAGCRHQDGGADQRSNRSSHGKASYVPTGTTVIWRRVAAGRAF